MIDDATRAEFLAAFLDVASQRLSLARELAADAKAAHTLAHEMHALAGEASILQFHAVIELARAIEKIARANDLAGVPPLLVRLAAAVDALAVPPAPAPSVRPAARSGRVLLVDDSELYRVSLASLLTEAGYAVTAAAGLAEARRVTEPPDLILLDLHLGDEDGTPFAVEARGRFPKAVLVLLTGDDPDDLGDEPVDAVLPKLLTPAELLARLDELLASASAE